MSSVTVEIRNALPKDAPALSAVFDGAYRGAHAGLVPALHLERQINLRGLPWWAQLARRWQGGLLVMDVGGQVIGYALIGACRKKSLECDSEIYELCIRPEYQGLGFGSKLLRAVLERLSQMGRRHVALSVLKQNKAALAFCQHRGGKKLAQGQERFGATPVPRLSFGFALS